MTILDLWYFVAKSFKNFAGGKENFSAIAGAITNISKSVHINFMESSEKFKYFPNLTDQLKNIKLAISPRLKKSL